MSGTVSAKLAFRFLTPFPLQGYLTVERRETSGNALGECAQALEFLSNLFA